jgi:hypothetical protein
MSCVRDDGGMPIETCGIPPNEILSFKSQTEINLVYIVWEFFPISDIVN